MITKKELLESGWKYEAVGNFKDDKLLFQVGWRYGYMDHVIPLRREKIVEQQRRDAGK